MIELEFLDNNNIPYGQDFSFFQNIPSGIRFKVDRFINSKKTKLRLSADGYGNLNKNYGNGAIYVSLKDLPKELQAKLKREINYENL